MLNFYLYSVTSISLFIFYIAGLTFARGVFLMIFGGELNEDAIGTLASGVGYAIVAFPLWWIHWNWLRQQFNHSKENAAGGHKFYLFTIVCLNAMAILFAGGVGVSSLVKYLFGAGNTSPQAMASSGVMIIALLFSIGLWRHHWQQFSIGFNGKFPFKNPENESPAEAVS